MLSLRSYSFIAILTFFSGMQSLYAMNSKELVESNDVQKFFKPYLKGIVQRIDSNFKTLLELCCYNPSPEKYKELCASIHQDFVLLVDCMKKDMLDWHPDLVQSLCNEIEKQLVASFNTWSDSPLQIMKRVVTAWRMKNYLFDVISQKRVKKRQKNEIEIYCDYFKSQKVEPDDKRSLNEVMQEYIECKKKFKHIKRIQLFFDKVDKKINEFKEDEILEKSKLTSINDNSEIVYQEVISFPFLHYIISTLSFGFINPDDDCNIKDIIVKDKMHNEDDKEKTVKYLNNKLNSIQRQIKNCISKNLTALKAELSKLPALLDPWVVSYTKFLNLLIELSAQDCKVITYYDSLQDYNPKNSLNTMLGNSFIMFENSLQNIQKSLENSEQLINTLIKNMMDGLMLINTVDDLDALVWGPLLNLLIRVFEQIITSETCANAICTTGKKLFPQAQIPQLLCEIKEVKQYTKDMGLALTDVKELIKLIGRDRVGMLIKVVLTMAAHNPTNFKEMCGLGLHILVEKVNSILDSLEKKSQSWAFSSYSKTITKQDSIVLLSYLAQSNKDLKSNNKKNRKIVTDMIKGSGASVLETEFNQIQKQAKRKDITDNFLKVQKHYNECNKRQKETLDQYKRDEKLLMIRILEENNWDRKQSLEQQLSNVRQRMQRAPSNNFMNKTYARYKELELLQQKYA